MKWFGKKEIEKKEIGRLNLASRYGSVKPGYRQDLTRRRIIEFAYPADGETVILLGSMDGAYPYWISETNSGDVETNTAVVESILCDDFSVFTAVKCTLCGLSVMVRQGPARARATPGRKEHIHEHRRTDR